MFSLFHGYLLIAIFTMADGPASVLGEFNEAFTSKAACQSFLQGKATHERIFAIMTDLRERGVVLVKVATTCMTEDEEKAFLEEVWDDEKSGEPI